MSVQVDTQLIPQAPEHVPSVRRKYKLKKGTKTLREMRKYQKSTALLIQHAPFKRLVQELTQDLSSSIRYKKDATEALQVAVEDFMVERFSMGIKSAIFANRTTLQAKDLQNV